MGKAAGRGRTGRAGVRCAGCRAPCPRDRPAQRARRVERLHVLDVVSRHRYDRADAIPIDRVAVVVDREQRVWGKGGKQRRAASPRRP